jgi:hypothetical protein
MDDHSNAVMKSELENSINMARTTHKAVKRANSFRFQEMAYSWGALWLLWQTNQCSANMAEEGSETNQWKECKSSQFDKITQIINHQLFS